MKVCASCQVQALLFGGGCLQVGVVLWSQDVAWRWGLLISRTCLKLGKFTPRRREKRGEIATFFEKIFLRSGKPSPSLISVGEGRDHTGDAPSGFVEFEVLQAEPFFTNPPPLPGGVQDHRSSLRRVLWSAKRLPAGSLGGGIPGALGKALTAWWRPRCSPAASGSLGGRGEAAGGSQGPHAISKDTPELGGAEGVCCA